MLQNGSSSINKALGRITLSGKERGYGAVISISLLAHFYDKHPCKAGFLFVLEVVSLLVSIVSVLTLFNDCKFTSEWKYHVKIKCYSIIL